MARTPKDCEWVNIQELTPWGDNPRDNDHAVPGVAKSIAEFGWSSPIIARRHDGMIISGHTRYKAAQSLSLDKVLVRWMDLTVTQAKALALAENRLGEIADWDQDQLSKVLSELHGLDVDLSNLGWDPDRLADLIAMDIPMFGDDEPAPVPKPKTAKETDDNKAAAADMKMVEVYMTADEDTTFRAAVRKLAAQWEMDNLSSVVLQAVINAAGDLE